MPNFKENPNAKKPSGFKMKYDNSAFPFKSPLKHPTHEDHHKGKGRLTRTNFGKLPKKEE